MLREQRPGLQLLLSFGLRQLIGLPPPQILQPPRVVVVITCVRHRVLSCIRATSNAAISEGVLPTSGARGVVVVPQTRCRTSGIQRLTY